MIVPFSLALVLTDAWTPGISTNASGTMFDAVSVPGPLPGLILDSSPRSIQHVTEYLSL